MQRYLPTVYRNIGGKMNEHLDRLSNKINSDRHKGRIAAIRQAFETYLKNMPTEPGRGTIIGAMLIGLMLGVAVTWGIMGVG